MQSSTSHQSLKLDFFLISGNSIFKYVVFLFENSRMYKLGSLVYNIPQICLTLNANAACENFTFVLLFYILVVLRTAAVEMRLASLKSNSEFVDRNSTICHYKHSL